MKGPENTDDSYVAVKSVSDVDVESHTNEKAVSVKNRASRNWVSYKQSFEGSRGNTNMNLFQTYQTNSHTTAT